MKNASRIIRDPQTRRGVVTTHVIIAIPTLMTLLAVVTDVGNLWLARVELEHALEAGAVAGAEEWGNQGVTPNLTTVRNVTESFIEANVVRGQAVAADPNANVDLGEAELHGSGLFYRFTVDNNPDEFRSVRTHATISVPSLWNTLFGVPIGPYNISAQAYSRNDRTGATNGSPRLIYVE